MPDAPGLGVKEFLISFLLALLRCAGLKSLAWLTFCPSIPTATALEGDLARDKVICHSQEDFSPLPSLAFNLK